jgi:hypothetical protein
VSPVTPVDRADRGLVPSSSRSATRLTAVDARRGHDSHGPRGPHELFPADFGSPLWFVYVVWAAIVFSLYPLCRWFARVKARSRAWWASYV